jgi:hypothetical protein
MPNVLNIGITTAQSAQVGTVFPFSDTHPRSLLVQANFTYGSGGTSVDAYLQTTADGGATWIDLANFHFTTSSARKLLNLSSLTPVTSIATPTDGSLASNTAVDGLIGSSLRIKYTTVGTYAGGTTLKIDVSTVRLIPQAS